MKKESWEMQNKNIEFGEEDLEAYGFIHCSSIEYVAIVHIF